MIIKRTGDGNRVSLEGIGVFPSGVLVAQVSGPSPWEDHVSIVNSDSNINVIDKIHYSEIYDSDSNNYANIADTLDYLNNEVFKPVENLNKSLVYVDSILTQVNLEDGSFVSLSYLSGRLNEVYKSRSDTTKVLGYDSEGNLNSVTII